MFKHTKINLLVSSFLVLTSCATIKENLGIEPPEMSDGGMGAAAGAAIGGAAGAVIGSTSGNAGEGLLLGGAVGAVSGAVIGTELGERDQEYASHKETLDNQDRQIQYQNRQLDKVRGSSFDTSGRFIIPSNNRSSLSRPTKVNSYASSRTYSPAVQTKPVVQNQEITNQLRARLTEPSQIKPKTSLIAPPQAKTVLASGGTLNSLPKSAVAPAIKPAESALKQNKTEDLLKQESAKKEVNTALNKSVKPESSVNNASVAKLDTAKTEQAKTGVTEAAKVTTESAGSCSEAEGEARRARTAATDTDKIFYYRRALRLCKTKPEYHVEMGKVYSSIGRKEEAEFEYSKALEIDPNNRDAQDELTVLMLDSGN